MEKRIRKIIAAAMIMTLMIPSALTGMAYAEEKDINKAAEYEDAALIDQEVQAQTDDEEGHSASGTEEEYQTDGLSGKNDSIGNVENDPSKAEETAAADAGRSSSGDAETETEEVKEEKSPVEELEVPAEETEPSETEDIAFNATKGDYLAYDPLYISRYADPDLVNVSEMDMTCFYNIKAAAKGIATYNVKTQGDFRVTEKNFIAGLVYEMPLYDVDPSCKYYLAIPNVNLFNDNFRAFDLQVGYNNDYAEMISGWKYRKGILYIPKKAVDSPKNDHGIPDGAPVAVQLNYAIGGDMDFSKSIPVQILDGDEPVEKTLKVSNFFAAEGIEINTGIKNRKSSDVFVYLNGSLIPAKD